TEQIEYDKVMEIAKKEQPKKIVAGGSAYVKKLDFKKFRQIADAEGAYLLVDMAHIAGLVAAGLHSNPVPHAYFVTSMTHKTLLGLLGCLILTKDKYAKAVDNNIFPGIQGGPLMHVNGAKVVAFGEAQQPEFKEYHLRVLDNAKALAESLAEGVLRIVSES